MEIINYCIFKTAWGYFGLLANDKGLIKTSLPADTYESAKNNLLNTDSAQLSLRVPSRTRQSQSFKLIESPSIFPDLQKAIIDYYNGIYVDFNNLEIPFDFTTLTDFSKKVLLACKSLNIGQTITYAGLAALAGSPRAARAAGSVMAANQWPLLIGCHRIIRADGIIGNFSGPGGTATKKRMLAHEQAIINKGVRNDSHKENRIGQRPGGHWPLFAGDQNKQHALPLRPDWT